MSTQSTHTKTTPPPAEKPHLGPQRASPPHVSGSPAGDVGEPPAGGLGEPPAGERRAGSAAANEPGPRPKLPVDPLQNPSQWLLLNIVIPSLLLSAAVGLVWILGTVQAGARPAVVDTPVGRLFALPAVDVMPVRSLASTGEKLHLSADGTVVPFREVSLATEVAGRIIEKSPLCETGKYVTKGHVLMKIDPTDYELEVKRLQRLQQQQYESLGEIDQEVVNIKRSLELARAEIELQQREVKRREALPKQFASQGEIDQARRAVLTAEQQLVLYQNQIELAKKRRTRLESSERLAAIELEAAENNLKRTEIIAPIDGVIVSEQAELNTFVSRGSPVVTIEDTSKVEVATQLRADQLYWVLNQKTSEADSLQQPDLASGVGSQDRGYRLPVTPVLVRYVVSGREGLAYQWMGKLVGYNGIGLDEKTRTVPVRIVVEDPRAFEVIRDGKVLKSPPGSDKVVGPTTLVRGMFVTLRLELDPAVDLVVMPSEALKPGNRVWQFMPDSSVLEKSIAPVSQQANSESAASENSELNAAQSAAPRSSTKLAEVAKSDDQSESPSPQAGSGDAGSDASPADPLASFDASAWVPGNLRILRGVRPVDRFVTTEQFDMGQFDTSGSEAVEVAELDRGAGEFWICEIPSESIGDGSFVVVSPVGTLGTDVLPVRAPSADIGKVVEFEKASETGIPSGTAVADTAVAGQ